MKKLTLLLALMLMIAPVVNAEANSEKVEMESQVDSITVSSTDKSGHVEWEIEGESAMGFKVVWSKSDMPEYPARDTDSVLYRGKQETRDAYISGFDGAGTYNVRVCEYLDGVCGTYSNQIQVELEGKKEHKKLGFKDLSDKNENYEAIEYLYKKDVVKGYEDGSFKAEKAINRAEFLKILMELSDYEPEGANCFTDVTDQWFAKYVCKAAELGVVEGYENGSFKPERDINFAEASKIIVNTLALQTDETDDENWFHSYVSAMELLSAIPTTVDGFDKKITRGEMSEMVYRIHAKKNNKKSKSYKELKGEKVEDKKSEDKDFSKASESTISSIILSQLGENKIGWEVEGESPQGFKVVWSKSSSPEYPARDSDRAQYHGAKNDKTSYIKGFDGAGTYSVRVCDYFDGECSVYSNEIKMELK